jgi:hypothetical protein
VVLHNPHFLKSELWKLCQYFGEWIVVDLWSILSNNYLSMKHLYLLFSHEFCVHRLLVENVLMHSNIKDALLVVEWCGAPCKVSQLKCLNQHEFQL